MAEIVAVNICELCLIGMFGHGWTTIALVATFDHGTDERPARNRGKQTTEKDKQHFHAESCVSCASRQDMQVNFGTFGICSNL